MTEHFKILAPGVRPAGRMDVTAPFDNHLIATIDQADISGVETALSTAHALYRDRNAWLPKHRRITILERAATLLHERIDAYALEAAREGGKPLTDSKVELLRAVDGLRGCVECLRTESGRTIPMGINPASAGRLALTDREPIGVVVAVSAFNHPMNLIVHQIGPAIAAGCPVIVKPAGDTPLSCFRLVRLLHEAGLPEAWCQALTVTWHAVTETLVRDPRVAFFSFIGSSRVGWSLRSKLAPGTRCALEHGGVAPVLVEADADIGDALPLLAKGAFYHAGQVCVSVQRVFAHRDIARPLADGIADIAKDMKVGDPTLATTEIGPLIRPQEVERVDAWIDEAREAGTEVICGGESLANNCYAPTVLYDPADDLSVSTAEIFGPVVCIYPYDDMDEAIARANALPFSFQAAVFCKNIDRALHAWRHLDASAVMVNDHTAFRVDWMPFAGLRESGYGVGGIPYTFREMSVEKMLVIRSAEL